jgi:site-specific DNA recombinase
VATETTATPAAVTALRSRILARFTELEDERAAITAQLAKLDRDSQPAPDVDQLDQLPVVGDLMAALPTGLYRQLYDAFGIELLYHHDLRQVTIHAAITTSTPAALAAIIRQCDAPLPPALAAALSDLERHPGTCRILRDHERAGAAQHYGAAAGGAALARRQAARRAGACYSGVT